MEETRFAGMSPDELRDLMRDLLPKMDLPILSVEAAESGATYTCQGGRVVASTGRVSPEALQPLTLDEGRALCISTGGFTDDAATYGAEFGVQLIEAGDLALLVDEFEIGRPKLRQEAPGDRFLPSIDALESIMEEASKAFAAGRYEEAESHYARATELKPHYDLAWALRGVCRQQMGEYDAAMAYIQKALDTSIENPDVWFYLAALLYEQGRHDEELQAYDQALRLRPGFAEAWFNKGATLHKLGRYEDALECYDAALEAGGKSPGVLTNRGTALMRLDRYEEAIEPLETAVEAFPGAIDAHLNLAVAYQALGRHVVAIESFEVVLSHRPEDASVWTAKGESHLELREEEALECFHKALALTPDYGPAKDGMRKAGRMRLKPRAPESAPSPSSVEDARTALAGGDLEAAAEAYEAAAREAPEDPEVWYESGMTSALAGDLEGALVSFSRAIELKGDDLRFLLSRMGILTELGRHEEALEDSNAALKVGVAGLELWLRRGEIFRSLGMPREAAQCFNEALQVDDSLAAVWNERGQALAKAGQVAGAKESLEKALALDPELRGAKERLKVISEAAKSEAYEFLMKVPGVSGETAEALVVAGFKTVADLRAAADDELRAVHGVGPATAKKILAHLKESAGAS